MPTTDVVLVMPQYRNVFLWFAVLVGGAITAIPAASDGIGAVLAGGTAMTLTAVAGGLTALSAALAVVLYRARLTIGTWGFREELAVWGDVEYAWTEVSAFYIRHDDEAVDAVGYEVLATGAGGAKSTHRAGRQILAGSYPGTLQALCDRLNRARDEGLAATTGPASHP